MSEQLPMDFGGDGEPELRRARFVVAYRGDLFHGFAANPGVRTVMGDLTEAIATIARRPVALTGAGRTDAGVHAWGQVVSGDLPADIDLGDVARRVNKLCAPGIAVRDAGWAEPDFDARFSATWRRYRYEIWNDPAPDPLHAGLVWHVARPLDVARMREAVAPLIGEHDFTSFCRAPKVGPDEPVPSMVRILREIRVERVDASALVRVTVRGTAFCHQMVRSIVGVLVDVGLAKRDAHDVKALLDARDRSRAGTVAPPEGLTLWDVGYDGRRWDS